MEDLSDTASTGVRWGAYGGIFRVSNKRPVDEGFLLIERVVSGDKAALEEIYDRFGDDLFRYLFTFTRDRQLAEEILQETLVSVWQGANSFRGRSSAKTWIFGVARHQACNALRRHALPLAQEGELEAIDNIPAADSEPGEVIFAEDRLEELAEFIGRLSPVHREILTLVFFHGLSYTEAAEVLGARIGTVKSRLYNAKRALRTLLEEPEWRGR